MIGRKIKLCNLNKLYFLKESRNRSSIFFEEKRELFLFIKLKVIIGFSLLFILLNKNKVKESHDINIRDIRFITCYFGAKEIKSNHRIKKYFQVLDNFVPNANIIFCVNEYTKIDPIVIQHQNITITIERFGNQTKEELRKKYPYFSRNFFSGIRYYFYSQYLKNHSEIKYVVISDDDTLFFRDPFPLINKDLNVVHFMEDILPFSVRKDHNYIWINAWASLDKKIKEKCGFKQLNLSSDEFNKRIPINSGLLIGNSKNIIKITDLISTKFICPGMFPNNNEQGLLNYLDLSGELKKLNIPIKRHNIYKDSILSCPNLLPIKNYIQQINSLHFIALHHHQFLNKNKIERSPKEFKIFLKKKNYND